MLNQPIFSIETIVIIIKKDIIPLKIVKKGSIEDKIDFLKFTNKLFSKQRKEIYKNRWKTSIRKSGERKTTISSLNSFDKRQLLTSMTIKK